nr:immunoglobulin light chain junction region [Macaca mulatta]MOX19776.1 immunoglobulin light chain junction region [Macaca mulatta]MOX20064.1 immunoglobulin light chain junction region [Macaca mulatta]MOX20099.1 immunoglobulin light chain junction region [Macaca mulatta]MOX20186.1 immunoglobulin light chain junction region [Macaca mulatta]
NYHCQIYDSSVNVLF